MSRWFRHYAGMMRDDKLVRAALKCGQSIERVVWIWGAILESAAEIDDGGRYEIDHAEMAWFLRVDARDIVSIEGALRDLGRVAEGVVARWGARQFKSDRSATRQAAYRERSKTAGDRHADDIGVVTDRPRDSGVKSSRGGVTAASRHGDAPETETELETEPEKVATQPSARAAAERAEVERQCREAAGLIDATSPSLADISPIWTLIAAGYDLHRDILPKLAACNAAGKKGRTWAYYVPAITEGKAANGKIAPKAVEPSAKPMDWVLHESPQWKDRAAAYRAQHGKDPPRIAGLGGMGWHFAAEPAPQSP